MSHHFFAPRYSHVNLSDAERSKPGYLSRGGTEAFWKGVRSNLEFQRQHKMYENSIQLKTPEDLKRLPQGSWLFHPDGARKVKWDVFIGLLVFYSVLLVPYRIAFDLRDSFSDLVVELLIDSVFCLDILFSFNTAYISHEHDILVCDRTRIVVRYLGFWFWIDSVSSIPFGQLTNGKGVSALKLIKFARLFRVLRLLKFATRNPLNEYSAPKILEFVTEGTQQVMKTAFKVFFVSHLIACFWVFLASDQVTYKTTPPVGADDGEIPITWISHAGLLYKSMYDIYVAAFYWTITTMLTVGYGDILPTSLRERCFAMCVMLIGGVLFGSIIAQVSKFIENRNPQARLAKEKVDELKAYLVEREMTAPDIRTKVIEAYSYYFKKKSSFGESAIFSELPKSMLVKLVSTIYEKEISAVNIFHEYEPSFVIFLVINSVPFHARLHDVISGRDDVAEHLVLLTGGKIAFSVMMEKGEVIAGYSMEGDYVGEYEFVQKSGRLAKYYAASSCNCLSISYDTLNDAKGYDNKSFQLLVNEFEDRYENFIAVKEMHYEYEEESGVNMFENIVVNGMLAIPGSLANVNLQFTNNSEALRSYRVMVRSTKRREDGAKLQVIETSAEFILSQYLLHPRMRVKILWDSFIGLLIVYSVIAVPVQIGFNTEYAGAVNDVADWFQIVAFVIDIILSFRTAYFEEIDDAYVLVPKLIYKRYLATWFPIDFVSTVPFDFIVGLFVASSSSNLKAIKLVKTFRLFRLFRLLRLSKVGKYFDKLEDLFGLHPTLFSLLIMYMQVLFIAHIVCCSWFGFCSIIPGAAWYDDVLGISYRNASLADRYITSFYWTLTTLTTVGYGDITPVNSSERIITVLIMMLGATIFGYVIANVASLLENLDQAAIRVEERVHEVSEYLTDKSCPHLLSDNILKHFRHMYFETSAFDEDVILSRLPFPLRIDLLMRLRSKAMKEIPLFGYFNNHSVAVYVFEKLEPRFFQSNAIMVRENDHGQDVFFITSGVAHVFRRIITKKSKEKLDRFAKMRKASVAAVDLTKIHKNTEADKWKTLINVARAKHHLLGEKSENIDKKIKHVARSKGIWAHYHRVKVINEAKGREFLGEIPPEGFFGHLALLENTRHHASVIAYRAVSCFVLTKSVLESLIQSQNYVNVKLQDAMANSIRKLQDDLGSFNIKVARAEFLFNIRRDYFTITANPEDHKREEPDLAVESLTAVADSVLSAVNAGGRLLLPQRRASSVDTSDDSMSVSHQTFSENSVDNLTPGTFSIKQFFDKDYSVSSRRISPEETVEFSDSVRPFEVEGPEVDDILNVRLKVGSQREHENYAEELDHANMEQSSVSTAAPTALSRWKMARRGTRELEIAHLPVSSNSDPVSGNSSVFSSIRALSTKVGKLFDDKVKNLNKAIFKDENLMYDLEEDSSEWGKLKHEHKFRKYASCPDFTTYREDENSLLNFKGKRRPSGKHNYRNKYGSFMIGHVPLDKALLDQHRAPKGEKRVHTVQSILKIDKSLFNRTSLSSLPENKVTNGGARNEVGQSIKYRCYSFPSMDADYFKTKSYIGAVI